MLAGKTQDFEIEGQRLERPVAMDPSMRCEFGD
jgi:hypothetical protein